MKSKNTKGFTLLEVVIAIAILTIIISIGYKIIDQSIKSIKDQGNINQGQLAMNDMNEYLTKDLEKVVDIEMIINDGAAEESLEEGAAKVKSALQNESDIPYKYEYKLKFNDGNKYSLYRIIIENEKYNISTIDANGVSIDFFNNERLIEKNTPFLIKGKNPYKVSMGYSNKQNKFNTHEFEVVSRIKHIESESSEPLEPLEPSPQPPIELEPPKPPVEPELPETSDQSKPPIELENLDPPIVDEKFDLSTVGCIGFWAGDSSKKDKDNLYVWHKMYNNNMENGGGKLGKQSNSYSGNFDISSNVSIGNSSPHDKAKIMDTNGSNAEIDVSFKNNSLSDKKNVYLQIYISKGVKLNINKLNHDGEDIYTKGTILEGGENGRAYESKYLGHGKNLNTSGYIDLNGNDDGYIVIMYGNIKK